MTAQLLSMTVRITAKFEYILTGFMIYSLHDNLSTENKKYVIVKANELFYGDSTGLSLIVPGIIMAAFIKGGLVKFYTLGDRIQVIFVFIT